MRAKVLRALSGAHQRLVGATTGLVLEAVAPYSERLREVQAQDRRAARPGREVPSASAPSSSASSRPTIDHSQPWEKRGTTEW